MSPGGEAAPAAGALAGRAIVVTRPARQAAPLARTIEGAGGRALCYPAIGIEPATSPALEAVIARLRTFDLAVFVSRNAVEQGMGRVREANSARDLPQAAAVGAGTRSALESAGVQSVIAPAGQADSEALLALPQMAGLAGRRVVIFRGVGGREFLADALRSRGAHVEYAECYRRVLPATDVGPLLADWARGTVDAVTISSGEGLANFCGLLGEAGSALLRATPVFVPHPRVADEASALGIGRVVMAGAADEAVCAALVAYFRAAG